MITFENVYKNASGKVSGEINTLWLNEGALDDERRREERVKQAVYIIRHSESGKLVGVSTAKKNKFKDLNNNYFYEFRCYISEGHRAAGLDVKLSKITIDFLESISQQDADKPIGVIAILENELLKKEAFWRRAFWPENRMYFIGYNSAGNPIRVRYFKGARI